MALLGTNGLTISGDPGRYVFPTAANGTFYVSDTGANTVYALAATGFRRDRYTSISAMNSANSTPARYRDAAFTGVSPHGVIFIATPEPGSFLPAAAALVVGAMWTWRKRRLPLLRHSEDTNPRPQFVSIARLIARLVQSLTRVWNLKAVHFPVPSFEIPPAIQELSVLV